ncbi:MAG: hypothetical protein QM644_12235 [Mobilitalea sp.]
MDFKYSKKLKRLMSRRPNLFTHIIFIVLLIISLAGTALGLISMRQAEQPSEELTVFDPFNEDENYSELVPELFSEEFASNFDNSIFYCFALDTDFNPYIVAVKADEMELYQDLINYTYDEEIIEAPEQVTLEGMPIKIDTELGKFAVDSYNTFMGGEFVEADTIKDVFGIYYLDTTQQPSQDGIFTISFIAFILILIVYVVIVNLRLKQSLVSKATLKRVDNSTLRKVDSELNNSNVFYSDSQELYLTDNYIISSTGGFDIIPFSDITHIYGLAYNNNVKGSKTSIIIVTQDNAEHEVAIIKVNEVQSAQYTHIVEAIKNRIPDIKFGFKNGFYTMASQRQGIEVDTVGRGEAANSNVLLGILGAINGAAIGGILWIVIGMLGFIAGIAGYVMMLFAIKGYRMLSGFLDKKGQIISLLIALLMIFAANYTLYSLDYCKYYYSGVYSFDNLADSFRKLPDFIKQGEVWGDFLKDLVVGYLLSIWAGFGIIKSIFSKAQDENAEINDMNEDRTEDDDLI